MRNRVFLAATVIVALAATGCTLATGELVEVDKTVEIENAESVEASFRASSANIEIAGGASQLMDATFSFNSDRLEPDVKYTESGSTGRLSVTQPSLSFVSLGPEVINEWDIRLGDNVPLEIYGEISSGNAVVDLGGVEVVTARIDSSSGNLDVALGGTQESLESVEAEASSGRISIDLTGEYSALEDVVVSASSGNVELNLAGEWEIDCTVDVSASSGQVAVVVPGDVNVEVTAETSSGNINADGFIVSGDDYVIEGPAGAPTLTIVIDVSSGNVTLRVG